MDSMCSLLLPRSSPSGNITRHEKTYFSSVSLEIIQKFHIVAVTLPVSNFNVELMKHRYI